MENVVQTTAETVCSLCTKGMNSLSPYKALHFGYSTRGQGSFLVVPQYVTSKDGNCQITPITLRSAMKENYFAWDHNNLMGCGKCPLYFDQCILQVYNLLLDSFSPGVRKDYLSEFFPVLLDINAACRNL